MKKGIALFLGVLMSLSFIGCDSSTSSNDQNGVGELVADAVDVWGVAATEKILQDKQDYSEIKENAEIMLVMAKNEYESSQIIITPSQTVPYYNVELSDLVLQGNNQMQDKIAKENISVYAEKYITVGKIFDSATGAATGEYPDALVPLSSIVDYKENTIEKGCNQGLYFTIKTNSDQTVGTYTGTFKIDFGTFKKDIPVTVEVVDLAVPETNRAKNIFLITWDFASGELNASQEMYDAYVKALFDYRLCPATIVEDFSIAKEEDIEYYVNKAWDFMQDSRCTNISIPYTTTKFTVTAEQQEKYGVEPKAYTCLDADKFETILLAYAKKSLETDFDMFEKSICYFGFIDEPTEFNLIPETKVTSIVFKETIENVALQIEMMETESLIKEELVASLRNLKNVVTCEYDEQLDGYVETFCPKVNYYDMASDREKYDEQDERWWYTCIYPRAPYPTYHMEDTLLSARALGWMQAEYEITGNLYWSVNNYASYDEDTKQYVNIDEYFSDFATRYPNVNGDGFLFYPGGQYGLSTPISSLRLEAIRDGLEEYELLYNIREKYEQISAEIGVAFDADKAINGLGRLLYSGTQVSTDTARFEQARTSLLRLAACAQSEANMCVVDFTDDSYGNIEYKVYLNDEYALKNHNVPVTEMEKVDGGNIYTIRMQMSESVNALNLSFEIDGKIYGYNQDFGGKVETVACEGLNSFKKETISPTVTNVNAVDVDPTLTGTMLKLDLNATTNDSQMFRWTAQTLVELNKDINKLVLHVYNPTSENISLTVQVKYSNEAVRKELTLVDLAPGMNAVEINTASIQWSGNKKVEYFVLKLGESKTEPARTIYIKDIVVYYK